MLPCKAKEVRHEQTVWVDLPAPSRWLITGLRLWARHSPVATSKGRMFWQLMHCSSVSGPGMLQKGQSASGSSSSSGSLSGLRTMSSIFFLYLTATWSLR